MPKRSRIADTATFVAILLVLLSARSSLADHYKVPSGSMEPTVMTGDRILVDKRAYGGRVPFTNTYVWRWAGPQPGEVVVLESPENGTVLLKRVVAGPGDEVAVRSGRLIRNDSEVAVSHDSGVLVEELAGKTHPIRLDSGGGPDIGPVTVPPDHYLVMGDNRGASHDGRAFGFVKHAAVLGQARGVYFRDGFVWRPL